MSILAIDYGRKRLGVAVSSTFIATPLATIPADKPEAVFSEISRLIKEYSVAEIVVGLPVNMDGTDSAMTREVKNFAGEIEKKFSVKVNFSDERLTSREAESMLASSEKNWRKRKKKIDGAAACLILESYLERKKRTASPEVK